MHAALNLGQDRFAVRGMNQLVEAQKTAAHEARDLNAAQKRGIHQSCSNRSSTTSKTWY